MDGDPMPGNRPEIELGADYEAFKGVEAQMENVAGVEPYNFETDPNLDDETRALLRGVEQEAAAYVESLTLDGMFSEDFVLHDGDVQDEHIPFKMEIERLNAELAASVRTAVEADLAAFPGETLPGGMTPDQLNETVILEVARLARDAEELPVTRVMDTRDVTQQVDMGGQMFDRSSETRIARPAAEQAGGEPKTVVANLIETSEIALEDIGFEDLNDEDVIEISEAEAAAIEFDAADGEKPATAEAREQALHEAQQLISTLSDAEIEARWQEAFERYTTGQASPEDDAVKIARVHRIAEGVFAPDQSEVAGIRAEMAKVATLLKSEPVPEPKGVQELALERLAESEGELEASVYEFLGKVSRREATQQDFNEMEARFDGLENAFHSNLAELDDNASDAEQRNALLRAVGEYVSPAFREALVKRHEFVTPEGERRQFPLLVERDMRRLGQQLAEARSVLLEDMSAELEGEVDLDGEPLERGELMAYALDRAGRGLRRGVDLAKGVVSRRWEDRANNRAWKYLSPKLQRLAKGYSEAVVFAGTTWESMRKAYYEGRYGADAPRVLADTGAAEDVTVVDGRVSPPPLPAEVDAEFKAKQRAERRAAFRQRRAEHVRERVERRNEKKRGVAEALGAFREFRGEIGV